MGFPKTIAGFLLAGLVLVAVAFILILFLLKVLWAWTVPDLFPGAVEQGLVAARISWATAGKLSVFLAVMAGIAGARGKQGER